MPDYSNLNEAAESNPAILEILLSDVPHIGAAYDIKHSTGYATSETAVRRWRRVPLPEEELSEDIRDGMGLGDEATVTDPTWEGFQGSDRDTLHAKLDETLSAVNANPENVKGLRVSQYQMLTKDNDGTATKHNLYSVKLLVQTRELAPAWPVVQPAAPVDIEVPWPTPTYRARPDKVTVVLPDPQFGYRFFIDDGTFDPFHDEKALDVALQVISAVQPDEVLFLGDLMDLPAFGKYEQEMAFAATTQKGIDATHTYLAKIRAVVPGARITVLEGNHDRRIQNMVVNNAKAAFGIRQALDTTGWPVLSVPFLCNFRELGVTYVDGYGASEYWFNDRLRAIHGTKVRSGGSTAAAVVRDDDVSTIFGHIHRVEQQMLTRSNRNGGRTLMAYSPGCLCRVDGAVPSMKGSTGLDGRPIESYENWQQAIAVVNYREGDTPFSLDSIVINTFDGYETSFGGKTYFPNA